MEDFICVVWVVCGQVLHRVLLQGENAGVVVFFFMLFILALTRRSLMLVGLRKAVMGRLGIALRHRDEA